MNSSSITVTSADGTAIAVDRAGQGPAVVLVGGGPTDHWAVADLAGLLAADFTVYNYDRRGRGASGDTAPWAIEREIEDLDAVIATAGGSAFVYGTSGGAIFAIHAAAAGSAINKLVLWEPPFRVDDSGTPPPADYAARVASLVTSGQRSEALELFFTDAVGMPAEMVGFMKSAPFWAGMESLTTGLMYDAKITGDFTVPGNASKVKVPTLVVDGGTTSWMTAGANAVAAVIPQATRATLDGQPHNVAADAIAPVIATFCTGSGS